MPLRKTLLQALRAEAVRLPVLSGAMLGFAFPTYPFIHLEPLAWIGFVPLLLQLKKSDSFRAFYRTAYLGMFVFVLCSVWWVALSTAVGGALMYVAQSFFLTVPLVVFYFIWKRTSWHIALIALPFIWTAWEWIYLDMEISFGWMTLGNSQSYLFWLIQYADLFGVWAISFWIILFNVCMLVWYERYQQHRMRWKWLAESGMVALLLLLPPLAYSLWVLNAPLPTTDKTAKVAIIQPNIDPFVKWERHQEAFVMQKHYDLTDRALRKEAVDMILYPETTIPFYILEPYNQFHRETLWAKVQEWQTPLLTGFPDVVRYSDSTQRQATARFDRYTGKYYDSFNSSMLITLDSDMPQIYHKMKLVPFAERVPYLDYLPLLSTITIGVAGISSWGKGNEIKLLQFKTKSGDSLKVCGLICYESIYPGFVAEFVRKGADFLTIITNDGWFGKSYGPYQHAAFARLRCIETRRAMARCANTGVSLFIDRYGRGYGEIPWWKEAFTIAALEIGTGETFYVRHIDAFAKFCVLISGLCIAAALLYQLVEQPVLRRT
ncbi:MAG: apolipoprotein N-acyltransferase [Chloroherpetonaceae bacterium]|nr:apolipoprotein N-acyltransferase [Chloroherpetonaceae bacterium]MCS7212363.1 apolipoprotein N-acyltransferase [Chloroherpetonaceae bacterium]MDW8018566.1 apolipoprotein N-acyltransferase [Chloroherpetonaceae bacterium]MDW8467334.1 apolipoprotein N-acyltransferase [Chloroherpetonaceae bacterium]